MFDVKEDFNDLVNKYIKQDEKEKLWELSFDCEDKIILHKIADYYIQEKDAYYICELLCVASELLNLDNVFDKIIATGDKTFMFMVLNNGTIQGIIDDKYFSKLKKSCDE